MKPADKFASAPNGFGKSAAAEAIDLDDDSLDDLEFDDLDEDFELAADASPITELKPNPVELPAPINPEGGRKQSVETHRNLFCVHYDPCLDEAVRRGWNSFSCIRCAYYRATPGEQQQQQGGVLRFATQRRAS